MPAVAFSVQRLRNVASSLRERRTLGGEVDRGFASDWIDNAASAAYAGAGSSFVPVWYDQSTNLRHASQATPGGQPRRVLTGAAETFGPQTRGSARAQTESAGVPLLSTTPIAAAAFVTGGTDMSATVVYQIPAGASSNIICWNNTNNDPNRVVVQEWTDNNLYFDIGAFDSTGRHSIPSPTRGAPHVVSVYRSGGTMGIRVDSGAWNEVTGRTAGVSGTWPVTLFDLSVNDGLTSEAVAWNSFIGLSSLNAWHNSRVTAYL